MTANLLYTPFRPLDANGEILPGGKLYTYKAGTTTDKQAFKNQALTQAHTNPIIFEDDGTPPGEEIWLDGSYKLDLYDSEDVQQEGYPIDNVSSFIPDFELYTTTGSANTYEVTTTSTITAYTEGYEIDVKFNAANTGAVTINVDTLGPKAVTKQGADALVNGDLDTTQVYKLKYDGTQFQIVSSSLPKNINLAKLKLSYGTAANPSYTFNGDEDTGFIRAASDVIDVVLGGSSFARFGFGAFTLLPRSTTSGGLITINPGTNHTGSLNIGQSSDAARLFYDTAGNKTMQIFNAGAGDLDVSITDDLTVGGNCDFNGTINSANGQVDFANCRFYYDSGTPTIRSSHNVSSISDDGVGDVGINLTNPITNEDDLIVVASCGLQSFMPAVFVDVVSTSLIDIKTRRWTSGTAEGQADLTGDIHIRLTGAA